MRNNFIDLTDDSSHELEQNEAVREIQVIDLDDYEDFENEEIVDNYRLQIDMMTAFQLQQEELQNGSGPSS